MQKKKKKILCIANLSSNLIIQLHIAIFIQYFSSKNSENLFTFQIHSSSLIALLENLKKKKN